MRSKVDGFSGLYWAFVQLTWRPLLVLGMGRLGLQLPVVIVSATACFFSAETCRDQR